MGHRIMKYEFIGISVQFVLGFVYFSLQVFLAIFSEQVQVQVYSKGLLKPFSYDME
jgi:hypothetical protein